MRIARLTFLAFLAAGLPAWAGDVLLVSEFSGKLLFLDANAPDPKDAVIAAVPLGKANARAVAVSPDGARAFVAHDTQTPAGCSAACGWVTVVSIPNVLNDTNPANDVITNIQIPRQPSSGGQNVLNISSLGVSPDNNRLAVVLPMDGFSPGTGMVYLVDLDPTNATTDYTIFDFQSLTGNLAGAAFRAGSNEFWTSVCLTTGTLFGDPDGSYIRDGTNLNAVGSVGSGNFTPGEAFSGPCSMRFDPSGAFAAYGQGFNGHLDVVSGATRASVGDVQFGSAGGGCAAVGTSFPNAADIAPDRARVVTVLRGSRPFNFGCGPLTSAVHGVGFVDMNPTTGALSNPGSVTFTPATDGSLGGQSTRFSPDSVHAYVLTGDRGPHQLDAAARAKALHYRFGRCSGESFQDLGLVSATIGAPRFISDYRDFDGDNLADNRCDAAAPVDFGDAPDPSYPTLSASNGASHDLSGLVLGNSVDAEADGQPDATASGDDLAGSDDEDGVTFVSAAFPGGSADLDVVASAAGLLDAWVDWNANGDWSDAGEQVFASQALSAGTNPLSIAVPASATVGPTFARFRLSSAGGLAVDGPAADGEVEDHGVTITAPPTPELSVDDVTVTEGNSTPATFAVTLSLPSLTPVTVRFRTQDVTASAGSDYLLRDRILTFDPGVTELRVTVLTCGDLLFEGDETFNVRLSDASGATIADDTGVGTILDNDGAPVLSISSVSMPEGNGGSGEAVFVVRLSNPSATKLEVRYATADGTAQRGKDYEKTVGSLSFKPGKLEKKIKVKIYADRKPEPDESFFVNLSDLSPAQGVTLAPSQGVATLMNDDH